MTYTQDPPDSIQRINDYTLARIHIDEATNTVSIIRKCLVCGEVDGHTRECPHRDG